MSQGGFFKCIQNSFDQGLITLEQRQWAEGRYKELIKAVPTTKEAKERLILEASQATFEKERRAYLNEKVRKDVIGYITRYRDRQGRQNLAEGLERYIEALPAKRDAEIAALLSKLDQYLMTFKKGAVTGDLRRQGGKLGNPDLILMTSDIQKALRGEKIDNPEAKAHAGALGQVFEDARLMFNSLGSTVPKLENWGGPQIHRWEKIAKAGQKRWVDFTFQRLAPERHIDYATGQPFKEDELKRILGEVWARGTTDGMIDLEPSMIQTGKGALYKQHLDHRFLHFKSADDWMAYAQEFGEPDFFAVAMSHLQGMARDITAMRYLGTNPPALMNYVNQFVKKHVATAGPQNTIRAEQMAEMDALMKRRGEIIAEVLQKHNPTFWEERGVQMMAEMGSRIGEIHAKMGGVVEQINKLRMEGNLKRNQADIDRMLMLQQELDAIQREIQSAKNDPLYDTKNPIPMGAMMELNSINSQYLRLLDDVRIDAVEVDRKVLSATERKLRMAERMWDQWRGATNRVYDHRLANAMGTIRNLNVASKLGGAMVSAISDLTTQKVSRAFLGMKSGFHDIIGGIGKEVSQLSRAEAIRMHILAEDQIRSLRETTRFAMAVDAPMWSSYLADRSLAVTGLTQYTEMGKRAFAKSFFAHMADHAGMAYDKLPPEIRRTLQRNDILPAEWDKIRTSELYKPTPESAPFLLPDDVMKKAGEGISRKYSAMMYNERQYAVIEPSLRAQTWMTLGTERGSVTGELLRSMTQFKSFGITIVQLHGRRFLDELARDGARSKSVLAYAANMMIFSTLLGALVVQLKDLIAGRDPRPMDNANFWFASTLQGGGWGIYGDFLSSAGNRFGRGLVGTIAGPTLGQMEDVANITIGNVKEAWAGKNTNIGSEFAKMVQGNTPFASTWYVRRALEAGIFDELQRRLDDDAYSAFRRRIDKDRETYGRGMWWEHGQRSPSRAPDVTNALGSR